MSGGVQSLNRALDVLEAVAARGGRSAVGEIATAAGLPVPTTHRLLRTLEHFRGDKSRTAQALGISVKTVYNHLTRHQDAGMEQLDPA